MNVEGIELDLHGLQIFPGLINAHDHLGLALFPRLGSGPWRNARQWAEDVYHPERDPVLTHRGVPRHLRLLWGGLRNLLAGVTTVCHHDPPNEVFDQEFPVRVVRRLGWAHSLYFTPDIEACSEATPPGAPFVIHLGEGTDESAAEEIFELHRRGALTSQTVLVHAVGLRESGWNLVREAGVSIVWCPRSNLFTLGQTLSMQLLESGIPIALGTDSPITAQGDLLDEIRFVREAYGLSDPALKTLTIDAPARMLRLEPTPGDWIAAKEFGEPPELVVMENQIRLASARLFNTFPVSIKSSFEAVQYEDRPTVHLRWPVRGLIEETQFYLPSESLRLGGRRISA